MFLADRNALIDQTKRGDFKHFKDRMIAIRKKQIDKAFEIYFALYQGLTNYDEDKDAYREFSLDFFDLVVVDECHRGSANADSAWREILDYFKSATYIGLTATPRETKDVSNMEYFGETHYTYSLIGACFELGQIYGEGACVSMQINMGARCGQAEQGNQKRRY